MIKTQGRLLGLAALFLGIYALSLTLSPAVRARSWYVSYRWDHWIGVLIWLLAFGTAHFYKIRRLPESDPYLLPLAGLLSGWGMLSIWRLLPAFGLRQSLWLAVALGIVILGMRLPSDLIFLRRYKYLWLTGSLLLTALTLLIGTNPMGYGPRMWLGCCGIYLQPSEPLKLLLLAYLAAYLAERYPYLALASTRPLAGQEGGAVRLARWKSYVSTWLPLLAPTLIMTGLALVLLVVQRDLGTASMLLLLYAAVVYAASSDRRVWVVTGLGLLAAGVGGYWLFDVVRVRVEAWINPWWDPSGRSYQIVQALIAVANGGLVGRGPGLGSPGLVPVAHSDLIYAAIAEEHGLVGAIGLLLLLAMLAVRGMRAALYAQDVYRRYLAAGLTFYLVGQALLIIGGSLRLLPLTGITLPFVSYGGSSLVTSFLSLLLLLHISQRGETAPPALPASNAYQFLGALLLAGLAAAALATGWWGVYRGPDLLTRTDNPRRALNDRSVLRGTIFDRNNDPINTSYGKPGEYTRHTLYPELSNVVGYTSPAYGQSGLEASLDDYLRGLKGHSGLNIWWNHLLYGQPPQGLDMRLSLDLKLQHIADDLLDGQRGALVLLNAQNGEILVMASHPTFDANQLDTEWNNLVQNPDLPLLNRAVLGRYPLGDWRSGLFAPLIGGGGLNTAPQIYLPFWEAGSLQQGELSISPLQAALMAAALSANGRQAAPQLVTALDTPQVGWVVWPAESEPLEVLKPEEAIKIANSLSVENLGIWQSTLTTRSSTDKTVTWYVGGTLPGWHGIPFALAVLLEENDIALATAIGQGMLKEVMMP